MTTPNSQSGSEKVLNADPYVQPGNIHQNAEGVPVAYLPHGGEHVLSPEEVMQVERIGLGLAPTHVQELASWAAMHDTVEHPYDS